MRIGDGNLQNEANALHEQVERSTPLSRALADNDVLFQELHHPIKNNLQIISRFLTMQALRQPDHRAAAGLQESIDRIQTMGLVLGEKGARPCRGRIIDDGVGMHLLHALTGQLGGKVAFTVGQEGRGTTISITFRFGGDEGSQLLTRSANPIVNPSLAFRSMVDAGARPA